MRRPPTRNQLLGKLALNAATHPFPVAIGGGVAAAAFLVHAPLLLPAAGVLYLAAAINTMASKTEQDKIRQRLYGHATPQLKSPQLDGEIAERLEACLHQANCIKKAITDADLPFAEVGSE